MIRFLPFIFIIVALLVLGGLGYWRFFAANRSLTTSKPESVEDRVASLENTITSLVWVR